jgi:hypothetical protein
MLAAVAATRILFRSHFLYDIDSVNFALGMRRFDPAAHQPHPPGYFLYILLARLVNLVAPDPNTALVAISIAASCGAAWMIYLLAREWYGEGAARVSMLLFLISPLCWFHGIVALTYMVEGFFSALVGYLCWKAYTGRQAFVIPAVAVFALATGFRPSTGMLAPLVIFSIYRAGRMRLLVALLAGIAVALAWFIPMTRATGGSQAYAGAVGHLWFSVLGPRLVLSYPWMVMARALTMVWIFVLCFGSAALLAIFPLNSKPGKASLSRFVWVWVTPGLLFFSMVFLLFVNSGYLLLLCPPAFALVAARGHAFLTAGNRRFVRLATGMAGIAANVAIFLFAPVYCSYGSVRKFETELTGAIRDVHQLLDPQKTLIVGFDSHFLGYRHAGYYLPHFVTAQYPEVSYPGGDRVFVLHERSTEVTPRIPRAGFENFVLFPLPEGKDYVEYLKGFRAKLPPGTFTETVVGRRTLLSAPISFLPALFPETGR